MRSYHIESVEAGVQHEHDVLIERDTGQGGEAVANGARLFPCFSSSRVGCRLTPVLLSQLRRTDV